MHAASWTHAVGVALGLLGAGCSEASMAEKSSASGADADDATGGSIETVDTGVEPMWWRLDADLEVSAGQLSASGSEGTIQVLGDDGSVLCSEQRRVASTDTIPIEPDPLIFTWWELEWGGGAGDCDGVADLSELPATIHVGVGEMHPELEAIAGHVRGLPEAGAGTLNGAYARVDDANPDVWVFGFAGDADAWLGTDGPATVSPLSDGMWSLRGAYSFPLR